VAGQSIQNFGPNGLHYSISLIFALFLVIMITREFRKPANPNEPS
jgi:hypothetical protein